MKYLLLLLIPGVSLFFVSCSSYSHNEEVKCDTMTLQIQGLGFESPAYDTALIIRYKQDNAFDLVIDTTIRNVSSYNHDTFMVAPVFIQVTYPSGTSNVPSGSIIPGYDYKIVFPAAGKTYEITNITSNGATDKHFSYTIAPNPPFTCFNDILSCSVNGVPQASVLTMPLSRNDSLHVVYLQK